MIKFKQSPAQQEDEGCPLSCSGCQPTLEEYFAWRGDGITLAKKKKKCCKKYQKKGKYCKSCPKV